MTITDVVPPGTVEFPDEFWRNLLVSTEHLSPETEKYAARLVTVALPHLSAEDYPTGFDLWERLEAYAYSNDTGTGLSTAARLVSDTHEGTLLGAIAEACLLKITSATSSIAYHVGAAEVLALLLDEVYDNPRGLASNAYAVERILAGKPDARVLRVARVYRQALLKPFEVTETFVKALDWCLESDTIGGIPPLASVLELVHQHRFTPETEEVFYRLFAEGMPARQAAEIAPALS